MNIKFMSGILAVALAVVGMSSPAMAEYDCDNTDYYPELADQIECHALALTCDASGVWTHTDGVDRNFAIWQFKGKGSKGCAVHAKLAAQLFTPHDAPPIGKRKGNVDGTKGAANDLRDGKLDSAVQHLCNFRNTIESGARLNEDDGVDYNIVYMLAMEQSGVAEAWIGSLGFEPAAVCAD